MSKNILIIKLSALGDVVHALPVSYAVKESFPNAKITWVVESLAAELIKLNPCVDKIIIFNKKNFRSLSGLVKNFLLLKHEIQQEKYDAVLDLQGLLKSAIFSFFAKSDVKLGTCDMREFSDIISVPVVGKNFRGHIVERYLDVARAIGCKINRVVFPINFFYNENSAVKNIFKLDKISPYVIFVIGANWNNKRWTTENFAHLGEYIRQFGFTPILIGNGKTDLQISQAIMSNMKTAAVNIVNRTSISQLTYILRGAKLIVGGDTGVTHLGAALGVKTIMLMGPTNAARNGSFSQLQNVIEVDRPCKGCWKRKCPHEFDCLDKISVEQVITKFNELGGDELLEFSE